MLPLRRFLITLPGKLVTTDVSLSQSRRNGGPPCRMIVSTFGGSMRRFFYLACIFALIPFEASAQAPAASDPAVTAADKAYASQDWVAAEDAYAALIRRQPDNSHFFYRLAVAE